MPHFVRTILITGPADEVATAERGHLQQLSRLRGEGKLRAAGRFKRGDGYLEIFEARDLHDAEAIARSSPLVELGLGTWMLREWEDLEL